MNVTSSGDFQLRTILRERDEAINKYEQVKRELEEMKKIVNEYARLKSMYELLKQDNDALKLSLESSERIRQQQKELIVILQKSQILSHDNNLNGSTQPNNITFDSISRISHHDDNSDSIRMQRNPNVVVKDVTDNREWLQINHEAESVNRRRTMNDEPKRENSVPKTRKTTNSNPKVDKKGADSSVNSKKKIPDKTTKKTSTKTKVKRQNDHVKQLATEELEKINQAKSLSYDTILLSKNDSLVSKNAINTESMANQLLSSRPYEHIQNANTLLTNLSSINATKNIHETIKRIHQMYSSKAGDDGVNETFDSRVQHSIGKPPLLPVSKQIGANLNTFDNNLQSRRTSNLPSNNSVASTILLPNNPSLLQNITNYSMISSTANEGLENKHTNDEGKSKGSAKSKAERRQSMLNISKRSASAPPRSRSVKSTEESKVSPSRSNNVRIVRVPAASPASTFSKAARKLII